MIPLILLAPTSAVTFSPPYDPTHRSSGSSQCRAMVPVRLHWSPTTQETAFRTLPWEMGKRRQNSRIFSAVFGLVAFFSVHFHSLSQRGCYPPCWAGCFSSVGCSFGVHWWQLFAQSPIAQGQPGVKQHLLLPTDPCWNNTSPTCISFTFLFM